MEGQTVIVRAAGAFAGAQLVMNGQPLIKQNGVYQLRSNNGSNLAVKVKPRLLDPIPNLEVGGRTIQLMPALEWYQYVWMAIPITLVFMGGALGGLCGGAAAFTSGHIFRSDRSEIAKYGLTGLLSAAAFVTYFVIASVVLAAMKK